MNVLAAVSTIMTTDLITVHPEDRLVKVKAIFDSHKIHHIPVVEYKKLVGIISKLDLLHFLKGMSHEKYEDLLNEVRLKNYRAKDIMTRGIAKMSSTDRINVALEVFKENLFHAIPIVDDENLVGIVTTYDIIVELTKKATV